MKILQGGKLCYDKTICNINGCARFCKRHFLESIHHILNLFTRHPEVSLVDIKGNEVKSVISKVCLVVHYSNRKQQFLSVKDRDDTVTTYIRRNDLEKWRQWDSWHPNFMNFEVLSEKSRSVFWKKNAMKAIGLSLKETMLKLIPPDKVPYPITLSIGVRNDENRELKEIWIPDSLRNNDVNPNVKINILDIFTQRSVDLTTYDFDDGPVKNWIMQPDIHSFVPRDYINKNAPDTESESEFS